LCKAEGLIKVKIVVLSDIHSNLYALREVLKYIKKEKVDKVVCLGDIVGYGPRPNECIDLIKKECQVCLMGNHDHAAIGLTDTHHFNHYAREAVKWTRKTLTSHNKAYLKGLSFSHCENDLLYVHSTPDHPEEWHYILSEYEAIKYLYQIKQKICFIGHTHVPVIFSSIEGAFYQEEIILDYRENKYIINVGSVGQPRDGDPRLCFVVFDTVSGKLKYIRLDYKIKKTYDEIMKNKLPAFLATRLQVGH
jgi:predicted phosphodiesterase